MPEKAAKHPMNPDLEVIVKLREHQGWTLVSAEDVDAYLDRPLLRPWHLVWLLGFMTILGWVLIPILGWKCILWLSHRVRGGHNIVDRLHLHLDEDGTLLDKTHAHSSLYEPDA